MEAKEVIEIARNAKIEKNDSILIMHREKKETKVFFEHNCDNIKDLVESVAAIKALYTDLVVWLETEKDKLK